MKKFKGTKGKWVYNKEKHCIESDTEWDIEPNEKLDLKGSKTEIISTYGTMGGNNNQADIKLICSAPELLENLMICVDRLKENDLGGLNAVKRAEELINKILS